jgi:hypothetical protein
MELVLSEDEVIDLRSLLDGTLGDLSMEIADTDNPALRVALKERRHRLRGVRQRIADLD